MDPDIKVTNINGRYFARCFFNGYVVDEMACQEKQDISYICHEMIRWLHTMGTVVNEFTDSSRHRESANRKPIGKVWYRGELEEERRLRKEQQHV